MNKIRILIMEHEKRVCRVLCRIIERLGFESLSVNEPADFESTCVEFKPDVVLLSLETIDVDHIKLLHSLIEQHSRATIILLSNMHEDETVALERLGQSSGLNMGGILRKPIDVDAVKSKLKDLVPQNHKQPLKKSPQISRLFRERLASLYALNHAN